MIGNRSQLVSKSGKLWIDGHRAEALAKRFGTPLYVYSARRIKENYQRLTKVLTAADSRMRVAYSLKANAAPAVASLLAKEGASADCASINELLVAKRAGMKERIYTGVFAPRAELRKAATLAGVISLNDISRLKHIQKTYRGILCFRVNPGLGTGSHPGIITSGKTKFGIPKGSIVAAYAAAQAKGIKRFGLHTMMGSGERDWRLFVSRVRIALDIAAKVETSLGISIELIDIGGGLGIPYRPNDRPLDVKKMALGIGKLLKTHPAAPDVLVFEPGRYLVGDAGVLLSRVTAVKTDPKRYVGVDAGMHTLLRPALYDAYHEILAAEKLNVRSHVLSTVVGPICETTDVLGDKRKLPELSEGDLVAILDVGAYGAAMSSGYGSRGLPGQIIVDGRHVKSIT